MKTIDFILPIYNESSNIERFYKELVSNLNTIKDSYDYHLIFVNDGSSDDSYEKLLNLYERDKKIKIINLSRNFGHQLAITSGLNNSFHDAAIIMDTDLQDPPFVALELIKKWEEGFEVVYAKRQIRNDGFFKNSSAFFFYRVLNAFSKIKIPVDTGDFRLVDKKVVAAINRFDEANRFMRGLFSYVGFKQTAVLFNRDKRFAGKTNYPLSKMFGLAVDGITSFSTIPLQLITQFGFIVSILSFIGILYAIILRLFFPEITVSGFTLTIISIFFIGGVQMIMLGIIGSYIGKIYLEVKNRPLYIIDSIISNE
jgi:dolichol-phosphate mannosyltransferase